jgi:hypothetical protein
MRPQTKDPKLAPKYLGEKFQALIVRAFSGEALTHDIEGRAVNVLAQALKGFVQSEEPLFVALRELVTAFGNRADPLRKSLTAEQASQIFAITNPLIHLRSAHLEASREGSLEGSHAGSERGFSAPQPSGPGLVGSDRERTTESESARGEGGL